MQAEDIWSREMAGKLKTPLAAFDARLNLVAGKKLAYTNEVLYYGETGQAFSKGHEYETDMLVTETDGGKWKPRVVIETKLARVSTHDAITYSHKAATHKQVHPYLRYGFLLGGRRNHLPGRLFRHGAYFDFMASWVAEEPGQAELETFVQLLLDEVTASRQLEEIIYNSRSPLRQHYSILHKRLILSRPTGESNDVATADEDLDDE